MIFDILGMIKVHSTVISELVIDIEDYIYVVVRVDTYSFFFYLLFCLSSSYFSAFISISFFLL